MWDKPAGFFMEQGFDLPSMASFGIQAALCGLKLFKKP